MQAALKKQAETYFQSIADFEEGHNDLAKVGKLQKFYTLLLSKYLSTDQLASKVAGLHSAKKIQWGAFIDAVWGFSLNLAEDSSSFKALSEFISDIDRKNIVDRSILLKSLPENLIDSAGLEKKQTLQKKAQRAYTKFYYDQKKHNLLRENNEGYTRLCLQLASMNQSHEYEVVWNKILSLIGNFDLDPDRVLDLLIESYVQSANTQICLKLIKNFNPQSTVALIGNRILRDCPPEFSQKIIYAGKIENFLTSTPEDLFKEFGNTSNPKLILLACRLIKNNFITFQSILPYLYPQDSIFQKQQSKRLTNGKQKINKSFKLLMEQLTQQQQAKLKEEQNLKFYGQMLHSSKLALINGFVLINDWHHFMKAWTYYEEKIDLVMYQYLLKSLFNLLEWIIDPLYSKISFSKFFKSNYSLKIKFDVEQQSEDIEEQKSTRRQMTQSKQLNDKEFKKIIQAFQIIKIYIGFNTRLYSKICRLFYNIIKQPSIFKDKNQMSNEGQPISPFIREQIQRIIKFYLLPGMSLQVGNPALNKQVYQLLELFDYRFRYRCYLYHYYQGMTTNPCLANIFYKTRNKQIVVVNNLSDKNKKIFMKKMAKLTHNQALQTFYWIFRRILMEDYEKVVPEIVGVLANSCPLTLQMSIFIALHILNEQKEPAMNFKTGQQSPWFKNLINFISLFYRKYLEIDIQPVFDYIIMKIGQDVSQLENNQELPGALLGLLHQILSKMFCNFVLKEVNKNKLEMLCAGPYLQLEAMDISSEIKASKKSKVILEKFFWGKSVDQYDGQSLAISLLVLLTQKRAEVIHKSYISNLKIIGDIYDDYTTLIIQLIRVLNQLSVDEIQYAKLLPVNSLNLFINEYKLPLEIAFEIYRPSVKHISTMTNQEWSELVNYVGTVMGTFIASDEKYIHGYSENKEVKAYLSENYSKMSSLMTNQFFTTFWMLTLDSIYFPAKLYTEKIEQVKKKAETKPGRTTKNQRNDREVEKAKTLYMNLKNEEISQASKMQETTTQTKLSRLKLDIFKSGGKDKDKDDKSSSFVIQQFAEIFTQICLLPRMMLDPEEALYCMKITLEVIKINKVSSGKSIKLLIFIIEHVMNSLPYATERQASYCLAIFLSEILGVIANWNDQAKLKQDLKKWLGIEENFVDENYSRLKKHFIKLYVRFGNIVKSIKDEPYNIKNCLYLLEKVDIIPAYKRQAEELENYLKQLKQKYAQSLQTIIQMQLSIIGQKKKNLPIIQEDIQPAVRLEPPSFSNLVNVEQPAQKAVPPPAAPAPAPTPTAIPSTSPNRSPIRTKNQFAQKLATSNERISVFDKKNTGKRQTKPDYKQHERQADKYKNKHRDNDREKMVQQISVRSENDKQKSKSITPIRAENQQTNRQIGQRQVAIQKKSQKNVSVQVSAATVMVNQKQPSSEKSMPPATIDQRRIQAQKQSSSQEMKSQSQHIGERVKTVKQIREQNARKAAQFNTSTIEAQTKQIQPQKNEKLKKQSLKDQGRSQKAQWPKQTQKEDKQKMYPLTVEFISKSSLDERKNQVDLQSNRTNLMNESQTRKKVEQEQVMIGPTVEFRGPKPKQEKNDLITQAIKTVQEKRQQQKLKQPNKPEDKIPEYQREKPRGEKIFQWRKNEKQGKYSQERNQERQRQYKRENRPYDKREKDNRNESRWKEREEHREKYNDERRRDSHDRSRRKQDKYSRERSRKNENNKKERERQYEYRK